MSASAARKVLLLALPIMAAVIVAVGLSNDKAVKTLDLTAASKNYDSLTALVAASDVVVVARAESVASGRTVGATDAATAAIKTELVTLTIGDVLHGTAAGTLTLEQEATLADGTPITVNGAVSTRVGDEGVYFLERSDDPDAPYVALVNDQSRYLVTGAARDRVTTSASDALSQALVALGPYDLRCQILAAGDSVKRCEH